MTSILDLLARPDIRPKTAKWTHPVERIRQNVTITDEGCWIWNLRKNNWGYGLLTFYQNGYKPQTVSAHKASWELVRGRVPEGMMLDHLCRRPSCVNPAHLEPVTNRENLLRSTLTVAYRNLAKTHCAKGHEFTPENTAIYLRKNNGKVTGRERRCRTCSRERQRRAA